MAKKKTTGDRAVTTEHAETTSRRRTPAPRARAAVERSPVADRGVSTTSEEVQTEAHDLSEQNVVAAADAWQPSYDDIARAAYGRYLERGGGHGRDFEDWLEAERELRDRRSR
jgi:hypothetical protein